MEHELLVLTFCVYVKSVFRLHYNWDFNNTVLTHQGWTLNTANRKNDGLYKQTRNLPNVGQCDRLAFSKDLFVWIISPGKFLRLETPGGV